MRVALVHDYLTQYGGAERVLEVLHGIWPEAPVFTSLYDPAALPDHWRSWDIRESVLARLPAARLHHRALLPLYPSAFALFRRQLQSYDVVLSDTSAWSHRAGSAANVRVAYCHSPARFLWRDATYLSATGIPAPLRAGLDIAMTPYRWLDRRAASHLDAIVANSEAVADRIEAAWRRRATTVIHPPVDLDRFPALRARPHEGFALMVSRLVPHKRVDLAVDACTATGRRLVVVGSGPAEADLRHRAGPGVTFAGQLSDEETARLMSRCAMFLLPGQEDFGITAVEAQAAGRPVVAFGGGGALETVIDGETGLFFPEPNAISLADAMARADAIDWSPDRCRANAARFDTGRFVEAMREVVERTWELKRRR